MELQKSKENFKIATPNKLLPPEEVASLLGITVGTLQVWRSTQRYSLPYVKVGRLVMYQAEAIQAFIENRTIIPVED